MSGGKGGDAEIKETAYDKERARIAGQELQLSEQILGPVEDYIIGEVKDLGGRTDEALGVANVESQVQFGENQDRIDDIAGARGLMQGGGADYGLRSDYAQDRGQSIGLGAVDANQAEQDTYYGNLENLAAYGQGRQSDGIEGLGFSSRLAADQSRFDVEQSIREKQQVASGVGAAAGIGYGLYKGVQVPETPEPEFDIGGSLDNELARQWDGQYGRAIDFGGRS